jgi:DNA mismatch repair protein MutS2
MCVTNVLKIYSSIGDQQSIENDLSTFSSQIIRIKEILSVSDASSIVLIDEICSGTDPQEGSALAAGILDTFINMKLFFVVTTHQSSLKTYALNREEISNASLEFDDKNMKPTYKFLSGVPGNSYAFVLAKNLGLSKLVLERSSKYLGSKQSELESSIAILQKYRSDIEEKQRLINEKLADLTKTKDKYERKLSDLKEKRQIYIERAKEQAESILTKANSLVESTIREIREDKKSISEIKKDYETTKSDLTKKIRTVSQTTGSSVEVREFSKGDYVTAQESDNVGIVVESDLINRVALVEFNGLKFRLPFGQLNPAKPIERKKSAASDFIRFDVKSSVDLRGMRVEEALKEVDDYISDALLGNIKTFTIIHGKGTGALKQAMQDYLRNHYHVESYRLGELVEGGAGVTIVELRYD